MPAKLADHIIGKLGNLSELYHRLVLIVGQKGTGKTAALAEVAAQTGARYINVNLEISKRMLSLTGRQRAIQTARLLAEVLGDDSCDPVLLDNTEILFDVSLRQDPLRLLQGLSRNRTIVAAWNGTADGRQLTYAVPDHAEFRRYPIEDLIIVNSQPAA
ncbi:MAG: BREX-3 system P-loop-containing protein BrxF [Planctomycetota bacterium]|nr:BREX-3 system P-loop-containing protein BrxF [Planctomycetota bacterium]